MTDAALKLVSDRLDTIFSSRRPALICYLPLGDPAAGDDLAQLYVDCGVDILEIGVPGANAYLDGPTMTESFRRARSAGVNQRRASELIAEHRVALPDVGMVWMTYPADDPTGLVEAVATSGVDAFLTPHPFRTYQAIGRELERSGIHFIHFLEHDPRLKDVQFAAQCSTGYVFLQANPGPTGMYPLVLPDNSAVIAMLRRLGVEAPIALGIGIGSPEKARAAVGMGADGVIVGSLTVETLLRGRGALQELLESLREAIDGA